MTDRIKALEDALTLAANRLHRLALDFDTGSRRFFEVVEWADSARAALAASQPAQITRIASAAPVQVCPICDIAGCRHIREAASQPAEPVAVRVKPLVWVSDPENCGEDWLHRAVSGVYLYEVGRHEAGGWWWQEDGAVGGYAVDVDGGEESAKSAAQADYEARIMAALDVQPLTVQDAARVPEVQAAFAALDAAQDGLLWAKAHLRSLADTESMAVNEALKHVEHVLRAIAEGRA